MCARCRAARAAGTRASVRNVVPLLVTVTSAHAAQYRRCIILCACRARRCIQTRRLPRTRERVAEYTLRDVPRIYSYYTRRLGVRASPRELEISPVATETEMRSRRLRRHADRPTCSKTLPRDRERDTTPRFRNLARPLSSRFHVVDKIGRGRARTRITELFLCIRAQDRSRAKIAKRNPVQLLSNDNTSRSKRTLLPSFNREFGKRNR